VIDRNDAFVHEKMRRAAPQIIVEKNALGKIEFGKERKFDLESSRLTFKQPPRRGEMLYNEWGKARPGGVGWMIFDSLAVLPMGEISIVLNWKKRGGQKEKGRHPRKKKRLEFFREGSGLSAMGKV